MSVGPYDELRQAVRLAIGRGWASRVEPLSWEDLPAKAVRRVTSMFPNTLDETRLGVASDLARRREALGMTFSGLRQANWAGRIPVLLDRDFLERAVAGRDVPLPLEHVLAHEMGHVWWQYVPQRFMEGKGGGELARQLVRAILFRVHPEVARPRGPLTDYWMRSLHWAPIELDPYVHRFGDPTMWLGKGKRLPARKWKETWLGLTRSRSLAEPVAEAAGMHAVGVRPTNRIWPRIVQAFTDVDARLAPAVLGGLGAALLARQLSGHRREA
jgi:hypothetical protein